MLGKPLPYEDLGAVRERMASVAPQLADASGASVEPSSAQMAILALDTVAPAKTSNVALVSSVSNFYMTDPVSRASATMAKCVEAYGTRA